jgi:hypothetical protein
VRQCARSDDIVVDLDAIARDSGIDRDDVGELLRRRNVQLAALADEPPDRVAWVIVTAPSRSLRAWWMQTLGVGPQDLTLLIPTHVELRARIAADPERRHALVQQFRMVDDWFARERDNDPGLAKRGITDDGFPTDPLHRWNSQQGNP